MGSFSNCPERYKCGRRYDQRGDRSPGRRRNYFFVFCHVCQPDKLVMFLAIKILRFFIRPCIQKVTALLPSRSFFNPGHLSELIPRCVGAGFVPDIGPASPRCQSSAPLHAAAGPLLTRRFASLRLHTRKRKFAEGGCIYAVCQPHQLAIRPRR